MRFPAQNGPLKNTISSAYIIRVFEFLLKQEWIGSNNKDDFTLQAFNEIILIISQFEITDALLGKWDYNLSCISDADKWVNVEICIFKFKKTKTIVK